MSSTFEQMTVPERILYLQDLWDHIAEEPEEIPINDAQRKELRHRVAEHRADPGATIPWEQVLSRARSR